jgi:excisionase family DNA binding protein
MLQYYTLDQAAKLLGINSDQAKKLLDDHKVRQYRDGRGGVRYVASAVDELARSLGRGSDPELPLGEAPRARTGNTPRPAKAEDESNFGLDPLPEDSADVPIGREKLDQSGSASQKSSRSGKKVGSKSPSPRSPAPQAGSDSDVRLVTDGSDLEFQISADSDVQMVDESDSGSSKSSKKKGGASKSGGHGDSEVRIVPFDIPSDSDVKITDDEEGSVILDRPPVKKHSDSDIRLEEVGRPAPRADEGSDDALVTEEIDLDAEERRAAETMKKKGKGGRSKMKRADSGPALPTTSPFELSSDDIDVPAKPKKKVESSSDFELTPAAQDSGDAIELSDSELEAPRKSASGDSSDEEVALGEISGTGAGTSGINLDAPMDSGISLEGGEASGDEMEFELSLDAGSTPKPGPKSGKSKVSKVQKEEDSDSEFELTLDADSSAEQPVLQSGAVAGEDSDSEFELTLDDSGGLVPLEGEQAAASAEDSSEESDIFETDFEVPALDDESGSQAVALDESDSDLESSDFDLALEEGDASGDEDSGSQVVALEDEGEVDEAAETVQRPKKKGKPVKKKAAAEEPEELLDAGDEPLEELADVDDEEAVAEDEEEPASRGAPVAAAAAAPAPWGPVPALVLLPCLIVMLLAGLMGYELINNMVGYQQPGKMSRLLNESMAKAFDLELPKD